MALYFILRGIYKARSENPRGNGRQGCSGGKGPQSTCQKGSDPLWSCWPEPMGKGPLDSSYNSADYIYIEWVYGHEGELLQHFNLKPLNILLQ
jgi:hypothetical protein